MSTKNDPGENDCYARALPDEPLFTLLGRDPSAPRKVREWAIERLEAIAQGNRPKTDLVLVMEAMECADKMEIWRLENDGSWRNPDLFIEAGRTPNAAKGALALPACTCDPVEAPVPCGRRYALSECQAAVLLEPKCAGAHALAGRCPRCDADDAGVCLDNAAHVAQHARIVAESGREMGAYDRP